CTRIHYDDPLAIREIKRFVADHVEDGPLPEVIAPRGKKVAIIGAGPAGLSCAYYLHIAGFRVTVFEAAETAGGTVASLIPSFRLPQESIERDIRRLINLGIQIHFHTPVDEAQFEKIKEEYEVVFVATGALKNRKLQVPGDDAAGVLNPLAFLRDYKLHGTHQLGKTIVVVGGGNTAMDAARTAKKILGKNGSVKILYRRTREDMPAEPDEIQAVLAEEIEIIELVNPVSIITDNAQVKGIRLAGMVTEGKGADGRNKVVPSGNPAFEMAADTIIPALGQESAVPFLDISKIRKSPDGYFQAGKNIFLGGDAARGGSNIISAIADGRKTAGFIIRNASPDTRHDRVSDAPADFYVSLMQSRSRRIYSPVRIKAEISALPGVPVFNVESIDQASLEASRCLFCDVLCNTCVTVCPNLANYHYHTKPEVLRLQKASRNGDQVKIEDHKVFRIEQVHQILHIADFCNECGNCETFCPSSGAPYKDKPHFFLTVQSFNACDEGFMISKLSHATILIQKNHNRITTLSHMADRYVYETEELEATFDLSDFRLQHVRFRVPCVQTAFFETAAMMKVLLHGAEGLYTHQ
ncbi:MAG: FAD-dependent oxidoreductase, partial [Bacteroidetes bacterium]|nr:FAD-dependent oxidoreductase [Bacteroidota bacterium]